MLLADFLRHPSVRNPLLTRALGADLAGFQTANRVRHSSRLCLAFWRTGLRQRIYGPRTLWLPLAPAVRLRKSGVKCEEKKTKEKGRFVDVGAFPMGTDVNFDKGPILGLTTLAMIDELLAYPHQLTAHVRRMLQIRGFQISLKANPELHGKVVLTQVAVQTTKSNELVRGVSDDLARVIAAFSTLTYQPVVFLHVEEVTLANTERGEYCFGFRSCFAVNPYDARGTTKAIYQALTMSDKGAAFR
ncbi:hypothetical protein EDD15DRAFT_2372096 [Pisolithus albus]|nr:hypothetical protein EDD15DRAFT_2372096 [Pisolithus albus]